MSSDTASRIRYADEFEPGMELPAFELPLTSQRLVMEASVGRDFAPIHHDSETAREHGAPDMFANTLLQMAIFEAMIREWVGLAGWLQRLQFRMLDFNARGQLLRCQGRLLDVEIDDTQARLECEIWIDNGSGPDHPSAKGSATLTVPLRPEQKV